MGNVLTAKDPLLHTTTCTYNAHNKVVTTTLPGGENTASIYDGSDNLTKLQEKDSGGVVQATTTYAYPASSNSRAAVLPRRTRTATSRAMGYDANGDLTSVTTPLGNETQWGYDGLGVKTTRTDALGRLTTYTLDGWERVTAFDVVSRTARTKTVSYDADSNTTAFTDTTGDDGPHL